MRPPLVGHRAFGAPRRLAACAVVFMCAASAFATAGEPGGEPVYLSNYSGHAGPAELGILGSSGPDSISIGYQDRNFTVDSPAGFKTQSCVVNPTTHAECFDYGGSVMPTVMTVVLGGGDDSVELEARAVKGLIHGKAGADTIRGSSGRNRIFGEGQGDFVFGNGGDDKLVGGAGADRLEGQMGDDILDAADGRRDALINCGPGEDLAKIDGNDPTPRNCEHIRRR